MGCGMSSASVLLARLHRLGVELRPQGDKIAYRPKDALNSDLLGRLQAHKEELLEMLRADPSLGQPFSLPLPLSLFELVARTKGACYVCGSVLFWRLRDGRELICAICHPSSHPAGEIEWRRGSETMGGS